MREEEKIDLVNDEVSGDSQPVTAKELEPVLEAMNFSGDDIQPLEDIVIPEPLEADYDNLKAENKASRTSEKSKENKKDIKKKRSHISVGLNRWKKRLIVAVIIIALLAGGSVGGYYLYARSFVNESPISTVYESGAQTVITLKNGEIYTVENAVNVSVSSDGMYMYYSQNTASKTGKYDIRLIDVSKRNSLEHKGYYIDNGVDETWKSNIDGSYMCYSKTQGGSKRYYIYSSADNKAEVITDDLDEMFMPSVGDIVYFTRHSGSTYSLHRVRYGEDSENVKSGIDYARACNSEEGMEVIYTVKSEENLVDVYMVKGADEPRTVCKGASEVYPQDYVYGGNLYYFIKNNSNVNWQDFITDSYYDSDATIEKPVEGDYMVEKGFIFKRYVLDSSAYNAAKEKYNEKLARDEVREALNQLKLGLAVKDEYTCYAFNDTGTHKLATGVVLDNIVDYSKTEAPRIIFRKSVIDVGNKISMDKLVSIASSKSVDAAIDYVRSSVVNSYTVSDDCLYSWYDGNKVLEYTVNGYDPDKTEFILASNDMMYALVGETLYSNAITVSSIEKKQTVDSKVTDYSVIEDILYYTKSDATKQNILYQYYNLEKKQVEDNIYSYFPVKSDYTIVLSMDEEAGETMSLGIFNGSVYMNVDNDADLKYFVHNGTAFAYIKTDGVDSENEGGDLYVYTTSTGTVKCGENATKIIFIHQ